MSGAVEGVARIKLDADGEAMVCTGCGTTRTVAAIVADSATAFTCCPERKMIPARTMWHAWCDANDARPALTTPPARSYADGVADILRTAQADCGCRIPSPFDEVAEHAIGLALATVSPGEKA